LAEECIFDKPHAQRLVRARQSALQPVLTDIRGKLRIESAADVGCGVGYFSEFLKELGFDVVGFDGRSENVEEAKRRYPTIEFKHANVEDESILERGSFDLVLCMGLLYHLENPLRALRNLSSIANQLLVIESFAIPQRETVFYLREEPVLEDQSLTYLTFHPSETSIIKVCYRVGFPWVYRFEPLPNHEDFQDRVERRRQRTMLLASRTPLELACLALVSEPQDRYDPWETTAGRIVRYWVFFKSQISRGPLGRGLRALRVRHDRTPNTSSGRMGGGSEHTK
jgi:SAM-dependent methyltransferase